MARMITGTQIQKITRKQLKAILNEATDIESAESVGSAMEYTVKMLGDDRISLIVNDGAETEHDLIIDRKTEISRAALGR
jgi:hypothetical protein